MGARGEGAVRLLAFCEAASDFRIAAGLVDRVLREHGPPWVADIIDQYPETIREWVTDGDRSFFDLHHLDAYRRELGNQRIPQGRFDGEPGAADALMARTLFHLLRQMNRRASPDTQVEAVLIVRDMDDQGSERRRGLHQAREEAQQWAQFTIVFGCPDPKREAWVLAGYLPASSDEQAKLDALRQELGFAPCEEAHRLDAKDEHAKRSAKRVLRLLTSGDGSREEPCWLETPLDILRARGSNSGLTEFLREVEERLVLLRTG